MNAFTAHPGGQDQKLPLVIISGNRAVTTSKDVADYFGKRHDNVIRDIRNLLPDLPSNHLLNFEAVIERKNPAGGEPIKSPIYEMTRDGFTLLAMGFTGKKALAFKLAYIDAFNRMEAQRLADPPPQTAIHKACLAGIEGLRDCATLASMAQSWLQNAQPDAESMERVMRVIQSYAEAYADGVELDAGQPQPAPVRSAPPANPATAFQVAMPTPASAAAMPPAIEHTAPPPAPPAPAVCMPSPRLRDLVAEFVSAWKAGEIQRDGASLPFCPVHKPVLLATFDRWASAQGHTDVKGRTSAGLARAFCQHGELYDRQLVMGPEDDGRESRQRTMFYPAGQERPPKDLSRQDWLWQCHRAFTQAAAVVFGEAGRMEG